MIVVDRGRKVLDGPPSALMGRHLDEYGLEVPAPAGAVQTFEIRKPDPGSPAQGKGPPLIALEGVTFQRGGRRILDTVDFAVHRGECVAIVGPNGSGKTTLLKHFNGLLRPTSGRVLLNGRDIRREKVSHLARHVGMAFQNPSGQFFKLSVWDEITVAARAMNRFDPAWIESLVRLFKLERLAARPPYRLSSGEKKRVAFAAALSAKPELLVLDEPTSGQDRHFQKALGGFLAGLQARGQTVVLVTHDLAFAGRYAPRWLSLEDGRITAAGSPRPVQASCSAGAAVRRIGDTAPRGRVDACV
jgi:energy-coupling factor transport system ATP-binding protein